MILHTQAPDALQKGSCHITVNMPANFTSTREECINIWAPGAFTTMCVKHSTNGKAVNLGKSVSSICCPDFVPDGRSGD